MVYEYPLPRMLQKAPANLVDVISSNSLEMFVRMDILVINSNELPIFLANLKKAFSKPQVSNK